MSSISKLSFTGEKPKSYPVGERHRGRPLLSRISSMTDDEIMQASVRNAEKQVNESSAARVLKEGPLMFLAATTMVCGALKKGKLSDKVLEAAKLAGAATAVIAVSKPVEKITGAVFDSNKKENKNTAAAIAVNTAATLGAAFLAIKGAKAGTKQLAKIFEPTAKSVESKVQNIANKINKSTAGLVSDKLSGKFADFSQKHSKLAAGMKISALLTPLAASFGLLHAANNKMNKQMDSITASNINKLTLCRELSSAALDKNV